MHYVVIFTIASFDSFTTQTFCIFVYVVRVHQREMLGVLPYLSPIHVSHWILSEAGSQPAAGISLPLPIQPCPALYFGAEGSHGSSGCATRARTCGAIFPAPPKHLNAE